MQSTVKQTISSNMTALDDDSACMQPLSFKLGSNHAFSQQQTDHASIRYIVISHIVRMIINVTMMTITL